MKILLQKSVVFFNILAVLLLLSFTISFAQSDTFQSNGGGGGEWNAGASVWQNLTNNTLRTFPIAGDNAYVVGGDVVDITTTTGAAFCATLVVNTGGILRLRGAGVSSLTVSGQLIMNSSSSSTINVGNLSNTSKTVTVGSANITAGAVNVIGTFNVTGGDFSLGGGSETANFNVSGNAGSLNVTNGDLKLGNLGALVGATSGTVTVSGTGKSMIVNSGGSLTINSTATASVNGFTTNLSAGSITIAGLLNINGGIWSNGGAVSGISGRVYNYSALNTSNNAAITLSTGGILNGPSNNATEGLGDGAIASSIDLTNGSISSLGVASIIKINGSFTIPTGSFAAGSSTITTYGTSSISAGSSVSLNNISVASGSLTLNSTSTIVTVAGTVSNAGTLNVAGLYQFTNLNNTGGLTNTGTISINGAFTDNGSLSSSSGTFDFNGTGPMSISSVYNVNTGIGTKFFNLTHSGSGTLTSTTDFEVSGSYLNSGTGIGTYTSNNVVFSGASINGGVNGTTFNNMLVKSNLAMFNSSNNKVNLTGVFTLNASGNSFDASGNSGSGNAVFTILSQGPTSTGSIAAIPTGASLSGKMTIQRWLNSGTSWKYLAIPISSTFYVSDLQAGGFRVTGHFASGASNSGQAGESMYIWNSTLQGWDGIGWGAGATSATLLSNTVGYSAYFYDSPGAISFTGTPTSGSINIPINKTLSPYDNLIPNPYPSAIDFKKIYNRTTSLVGTQMSIQTDGGTGNNLAYLTYVSGDPLLGTSYIAANHVSALGASWKGEIALGQSFWIDPSSTTNLQLLESDKTTTSSTFVGRTEDSGSSAESVSVRIGLSSSTDDDETVLLFTEKGNIDFTPRLDFVKKLRSVPDLDGVTNKAVNVYSNKADQPLVFNFLPLIDCNSSSLTVKLGVKVPSIPGDYTLTFSNSDKFALGYVLKLVDNFLGKEINLTDSKQYMFSTNDQSGSADVGRFDLKIDAMPLIAPIITAKGNQISTQPNKFIQWYKNGLAVTGATLPNFEATESGTYTVKAGYSAVCTMESLPVVVTITGLENNFSAISVYPNPAENTINLQFPVGMTIDRVSLLNTRGEYLSDLSLIPTSNNSLSLDISAQSAGLYILNLKSGGATHSIKILKK